jgi:hypothetical protein
VDRRQASRRPRRNVPRKWVAISASRPSSERELRLCPGSHFRRPSHGEVPWLARTRAMKTWCRVG